MVVQALTTPQRLHQGAFRRCLRAANLALRTEETYAETVKRFVPFLAGKGMPTDPAAITPGWKPTARKEARWC
ncbi:MAG: hypothetical protein Q8P59_02115 [Dehalococcoidia bacterium]|nr:hypothetical protein [Dehalococcoidia bacterium]